MGPGKRLQPSGQPDSSAVLSAVHLSVHSVELSNTTQLREIESDSNRTLLFVLATRVV